MEKKMVIQKHRYVVVFSDKGNIIELTNNSDNYSIIKKNNGSFGLPFETSSQSSNRSTGLELSRMDDESLDFESKNFKIHYSLCDDFINIKARFLNSKGSRAGLNFDYNFLDSDSSGYEDKLMLTDIYVDPKSMYGYFLFRRYDGKYVAMTINSEFAAYRLKYSYFGHKILGMEILARAKDVICDEKRELLETDTLDISIAFCNDLEEAKKIVAGLLDISIAAYILSGNVSGNDFSFKTINRFEKMLVLDDQGIQVDYREEKEKYSFNLENPGTYRIITYKNHREHITRVLSHKSWRDYYELICNFYKDHFQHKTGAFYRVIYKETLSPEMGRTFEGVHFGNPNERMSCRTGEFGGFAAWAIIKYILIYTDKKSLFGAINELKESPGQINLAPGIYFLNSAERYIENWALHINNDKPFYGTICREKHRHGFKTFTPYHLYKESNFPQYEIFLMEQLIDYYEITKKDYILGDLLGIANHFIESHIGVSGEVLYHKTDYTTVHTPAILFVKLSILCRNLGMNSEGEQYKQVARNMVEHIIRRGMHFPTEGEGCTEDGSVACSALSILYYCYYAECCKEYMNSAKAFLELHRMLEITTYDARMYHSSIRFWETQYETRDYGPSYNAGHAWTLWSAEAKVYYALLTANIDYLSEAYNGFVSNMAKVEKNGGMAVSYTPDMIPGIPHHCFLLRYSPMGVFKRDKKSYLGMKYPSKTYSATGNYFLVKYEETFNHISGMDIKNNLLINLKLTNGVYQSLGEHFDTLLLGNPVETSIQIKLCNKLKIVTTEIEKVQLVNAEIINRDSVSLTIKPTGGIVTINIS